MLSFHCKPKRTESELLLTVSSVLYTQEPCDRYSTLTFLFCLSVSGQRFLSFSYILTKFTLFLYTVCSICINVYVVRQTSTLQNIFYIFIRKMQWHDDKTKFIWSGNINKMGKMSVQTTLQSKGSGGKLNEIYIIYGKRKRTSGKHTHIHSLSLTHYIERQTEIQMQIHTNAYMHYTNNANRNGNWKMLLSWIMMLGKYRSLSKVSNFDDVRIKWDILSAVHSYILSCCCLCCFCQRFHLSVSFFDSLQKISFATIAISTFSRSVFCVFCVSRIVIFAYFSGLFRYSTFELTQFDIPHNVVWKLDFDQCK